MGIMTTLMFYVFPSIGAATYISFRLGPQLPIACRKMGQRIGMGYYLFKVILKINLPKDIVKSNEFIKLMRQTEQQANALNRELKSSLYKIKSEIKEQVPDELKQNPYELLQVKDYRKSNEANITNSLFGGDTIIQSLNERERLKNEKLERVKRNSFSNKI